MRTARIIRVGEPIGVSTQRERDEILERLVVLPPAYE